MRLRVRQLASVRSGRVMLGLVGLLVVLVLAGAAALWPAPATLTATGSGLALRTVPGEVVAVTERECGLAQPCGDVTFRIEDGREPARGTTRLGLRPTDPRYRVGDAVRVLRTGTSATVVERDRRGALLALALLAVVVVLLVGRTRGARSLAGLTGTVVVLLGFTVPGLLGGGPPVPVALVTCGAVLLLSVAVGHGIRATSVAAVLGAAASLLLTAGLAAAAVAATGLTGTATEAASLLGAGGGLSLPGLLLAGTLIATLGVLDDATIGQASVVAALRRADPAMPVRRLVAEALRVGRDHLGALVNTLVLAYAGASLPVLLLFALEDAPALGVLGSEPVAQEVVATLVGTVGVVAAVPITTVLAAVLLRGLPLSALDAGGHDHVH